MAGNEIEKQADRINRWADLGQRASQFADATGLRHWLAPMSAAVLATLTYWVSQANAYVQLLSPVSYWLIALIATPPIIDIGRRLIPARKKRVTWRVRQWANFADAHVAFAPPETRANYKELLSQAHAAEMEHEADLLASYRGRNRVDAVFGPQDEREIQALADKTERRIQLAVRATAIETALKKELRRKLISGELVATGFRGTLTTHDQEATPILSEQWRVLGPDANTENTVRGDGIAYSGVSVGKPWSRFEAIGDALFGKGATSSAA